MDGTERDDHALLPIDPDLAPSDPAAPSLEPTPPGRRHQRRARPDVLAVIAAGGMLGASARDGVASALPTPAGPFPWGTFVVNVTGCLALGVLTGLGLHHGLASTTRTVLGTGGLGAYTTFSTFTFETVRLAEEGALDEALRNAAASVLVGLAAAAAGLAITL